MDRDFEKRVAQLAFAPAEVFWRDCFLRSAYTREKPPEELRALGVRADACGRRYGRELRRDCVSVSSLCAKNGLEICELFMPEQPEMEIFALFEPPSRILVRTTFLSECDRLVKEREMDTFLGRFRCMDIVLCHEFFHFLEDRDRKTVFTRIYREPRGFFGRKVCLPPLAEIAAMGFAQEILGLEWSPFLLDCVMLYVNEQVSALAMIARLERSGVKWPLQPEV